MCKGTVRTRIINVEGSGLPMQGWGLGCRWGCSEGKRAAFREIDREQTLKTLVTGAKGIRLYPQGFPHMR